MKDNPDPSRTEKLTTKLLYVIRDHYNFNPTERARVYEVLNALAVAVALTIKGTAPEALDFFEEVLLAQIRQFDTETKSKRN